MQSKWFSRPSGLQGKSSRKMRVAKIGCCQLCSHFALGGEEKGPPSLINQAERSSSCRASSFQLATRAPRSSTSRRASSAGVERPASICLGLSAGFPPY
jgi:hypothetical protein